MSLIRRYYTAGDNNGSGQITVLRNVNELPASVSVQISHHNSTGNVTKIHCLKDDYGQGVVAIGSDEVCYLSPNAGNDWILSTGALGIGDLYCIDSNKLTGLDVWIGGEDGVVYFSTDAATNITPMSALPTPTGLSDPNYRITAIHYAGVLGLWAACYDTSTQETFLYRATVGISTATPTWVAVRPTSIPDSQVIDIQVFSASNVVLLRSSSTPANNQVIESLDGGVTYPNLGPAIINPNGATLTDFGYFSHGDGNYIDSNANNPLVVTNLRAYNAPDPLIGGLHLRTASNGLLWTGNNQVFSTTDGGATNDTLLYGMTSINSSASESALHYRLQGCGGDADITIVVEGLPASLGVNTTVKILQPGPFFDMCFEDTGAFVSNAEPDLILRLNEFTLHLDCASCDFASYQLASCTAPIVSTRVIDRAVQDAVFDLSPFIGRTIEISATIDPVLAGISTCWQVAAVDLSPTYITPLPGVVSSYRDCAECTSSLSNHVLVNCVTSASIIVSGSGFVVGQTVSLTSSPSLDNCWFVDSTTTAPATFSTDADIVFSDCTFCISGRVTYELRLCGTTAPVHLVSVDAVLTPGQIIRLASNTLFADNDCIEVVAISSSAPDFTINFAGSYADCTSCLAAPLTCYDLISCNPSSYPDILEVTPFDPSVDLAGNLGSVVTNVNGAANECYTVQLADTCSAPTIINSLTALGNCADYSLISPIIVPSTTAGTCTSFQIPVQNNSSTAHDFTLFLPCANFNLITAGTQTIPAGTVFYYDAEYCPPAGVVESGTCTYNVEGPCGFKDGEICYKSFDVPACDYFDICITDRDDCKPDCIEVGTAVPINISGTIDPAKYPITITLNVYDKATNASIFLQNYVVNDDTELNALNPIITPTYAGTFCAELCIPGCDNKVIFCFDVCDPFGVYKDDCDKWHIHRPHGCGTQKYKVTVTELEGEDVVTDDIWDAALDSTYEFAVPGDGIYLVSMHDYITGEKIYEFAIFETCAIERCFKILMDKIMCSCADPCCNKCNGTPQQEVEFARMTLNKLNPLYFTYFGMAHKYRIDSEGLSFIPQDTMCFLYTASQVYDKINELLETCDCLCKEETSTKSSTGGCTSC